MEIEPEQPKLSPDEEQEPYTIENLPVSISTSGSTVSLPSTILQISSEGISFLLQKPEDQWFSVYTTFKNINSVGISANSLLIFVGDQQMSEEEQEMPPILKLINAAPAGGNAQLQGQVFTLTVDFEKEGKNVLKEVHDIAIGYMGDADDHLSRYDEDEEFEKMISADDIDENGNIIQREGEDDDSSEEQGENQPDINKH